MWASGWSAPIMGPAQGDIRASSSTMGHSGAVRYAALQHWGRLWGWHQAGFSLPVHSPGSPLGRAPGSTQPEHQAKYVSQSSGQSTGQGTRHGHWAEAQTQPQTEHWHCGQGLGGGWMEPPAGAQLEHQAVPFKPGPVCRAPGRALGRGTRQRLRQRPRYSPRQNTSGLERGLVEAWQSPQQEPSQSTRLSMSVGEPGRATGRAPSLSLLPRQRPEAQRPRHQPQTEHLQPGQGHGRAPSRSPARAPG